MSRSRFGLLAIFYGLLMAYSSTIVGVVGPHYVPIDWGDALGRLIHMPYVQNGSDQRSDWMGNLVMAVPLGFLITGWFSPSRLTPGREISASTALPAFAVCFAFILLVKYAQLFFPPRTVTLNYVVAQSVGAGAGIFLFGLLESPLARVGQASGRLENLRVILRIYAGLLIVFMLMPLDFAMNADDLIHQLDKLPDTFTRVGGDGRAFVVRLAVILASSLATMPVGALLTLAGRGGISIGRSTGAATWIGFLVMVCVYAATTLVISGSASLPAVAFRTIGIALGAWCMHWLSRQNPDRLRTRLGDLVPWTVPFYLLTLFAVNGLLSFDWTTPGAASNDFYGLGLLPLFDYYIVTKSQAAKNIVAHVVMYAPIGLMIWFRAKNGGSRTGAFVLAALLSAVVEGGRFLRPGLVPDINAIPLAGIAAWAAVALMPSLWRVLATVATGKAMGTPPRPARAAVGETSSNWRNRADARRSSRGEIPAGRTPPGLLQSGFPPSDGEGTATGEIEHY